MQVTWARWGGTRWLAAALLSLAAIPAGAAQGSGGSSGPGGGGGGGGTTTTATTVSLRMRNQSAPPGGAYQMVVDLTEPTPIVIGRGVARPSAFQTILGVLLPADPGAAAVALKGPQGIDVRITAPAGGDFGLNQNAPLLAITLGVPADTVVGTTAPLALDPAASQWFGPLGIYPQDIKDGIFTAKGTLCVTDVLPGGGLLPAGSTISVLGLGFRPGATVEVDGAIVSAATFVSPTQLDVVTTAPLQLDNRRISVRNPDLTRVNYYSYLRAASLGESTRPLLAAGEPVFPVQPLSFGVFPSVPAAPATFAAVALQNPGPATAQVTLSLQSSATGAVATSTVSLPPRTEMEREISEIFPGVATAGTVLTVSASSPVQMLGISGDEVAGTLLPVLPSLSL
jgi:hypothetical protein